MNGITKGMYLPAMNATGAEGNAELLAGDAGIAGVADGDTGSLADLNAGSATATSFETIGIQ
ncbi:hypothetical protein [Nocardia sp. NPDC050793]|uniref:hypothetical protein n=1 Tax=Nocardia sp. NPDC050793 TaxID=3155159 RepID=UPI0033DDE460